MPFDSTIFIGNAYGPPGSVEQFLKSNQAMSARVIFIGDVFGIPSSEKWKDLANSFQTTTEIHIAPRTMIFKDRILGMYSCKPLGNKSFP